MFEHLKILSGFLSDNLIVIFNSLAEEGSIDNDKYDFFKTFQSNKDIHKLFFKNTDHTWYINDIDEICSILSNFTKEHKIKKICFIGHSCGGFASLLCPSILLSKNSDLILKSIAFSPQTNIKLEYTLNLIHLYNEPVDMSIFKNHGKISKEYEKYLDLKPFIIDNAKYEIYICEKNIWDNEYLNYIDYLTTDNIKVNLQDCDHHASAYYCKCLDKFKDIFRIDNLFP